VLERFYCESGDTTSKKTPYALQEVELLSWLQFGEAYLGFAGLAPHFRPLFWSHSVLLCSGTEDNSLPNSTTPNKPEPPPLRVKASLTNTEV